MESPRRLCQCVDGMILFASFAYIQFLVVSFETLRRVPHLTVTWAHQLPSFAPDLHYTRPSFVSSPGTTLYPLHIQNQPNPFSPFSMNGADVGQPRDTLGDAISGSPDPPTTVPSTFPEEGGRSGDYFDLCDAEKGGELVSVATPKLAWADMDFPPLRERCNEEFGDEETDASEGGRNE